MIVQYSKGKIVNKRKRESKPKINEDLQDVINCRGFIEALLPLLYAY